MARSFLSFALVGLLFSMGSFANQLDVDLSGKWIFKITEEGNDKPDMQLNFIKTGFKNEMDQPVYFVEGAFGDKPLWAASLYFRDGKTYISWRLKKGDRLDGEGTMILEAFEDKIVLGGDYEDYPLAIMERVSG